MNANQQALRHCKGHESYNQYCPKCFAINFDRSRDFAPPEIRSGAWVDALTKIYESATALKKHAETVDYELWQACARHCYLIEDFRRQSESASTDQAQPHLTAPKDS